MKKSRSWFLIFLVCALLLVLALTPMMAGCGGGEEPTPTPGQQEEEEEPPMVYELVFSDFIPPTMNAWIAEEWWMDEAEKRSNGRIQIEGYHSGQLFGAMEVLGALGKGGCDIAVIVPGYLPGQLDYLAGMGIPMLTDYAVVLTRAATEMMRKYPSLLEEAERNNTFYLTGSLSVVMQYESRTPITTLEDMQGLTIHCATTGYAWVTEQLGATPTVLAYGELYEAQSRGLLDGMYASIADVASLRLYEISETFTEMGLGALGPYPIAFNLDSWNSLPADLQKIFLDLVPEHQRKFDEIQRSMDVDYADTALEAGVVFNILPPADLQALKDLGLAEYVADEWINLKPAEAEERRAFINQFLATVMSTEVEPWMYSPGKEFFE